MTASGLSPEKSLIKMSDRKGWYDLEVLDCIAKVAKIRDTWRSLEFSLDQLKDGMILSENIVLSNGQMLLPAGQRINKLLIRRLYNFDKNYGIKQPIYVERE